MFTYLKFCGVNMTMCKTMFIGFSEFQKGYRCYNPLHPKLHMTLDTRFMNWNPTIQGVRYGEENDDDLFELEENGGILESSFEKPRQNNVVPHDGTDLEFCINQNFISNNPSRSPELPASTQLTEELSQNVLSLVNPNLILDETNEIPVFVENTTIKFPQRSNRGVLRKQYEPDPKTKTKYPISNYVCPHKLSESYAFSVNQLSIVSILVM